MTTSSPSGAQERMPAGDRRIAQGNSARRIAADLGRQRRDPNPSPAGRAQADGAAVAETALDGRGAQPQRGGLLHPRRCRDQRQRPHPFASGEQRLEL